MTKWTPIHSLMLLSALTLLVACEPPSQTAPVEPVVATATVSDGTTPVAPANESDGAAPASNNTPAPTQTDDAQVLPVVAETLPYAEVGNQLVYGHFVFPANMVDPLPGLIVIHEWWGLNDDVRKTADRIAAEGYVVLAVDLFGGQTAKLPEEARPLMIDVVENPDFAHENIRQALEFLLQSAQSPSIGVVGWDFGGGWALNAAIESPGKLDAVVIYYGQLTDDEARLAVVDTPVLGLFGEEDRSIPVDNVRAFEQIMENLGKDFEIEIYPGVQHAFAIPGSPNYDAAAAAAAWRRSIDFLERHLSGN